MIRGAATSSNEAMQRTRLGRATEFGRKAAFLHSEG